MIFSPCFNTGCLIAYVFCFLALLFCLWWTIGWCLFRDSADPELEPDRVKEKMREGKTWCDRANPAG